MFNELSKSPHILHDLEQQLLLVVTASSPEVTLSTGEFSLRSPLGAMWLKGVKTLVVLFGNRNERAKRTCCA